MINSILKKIVIVLAGVLVFLICNWLLEKLGSRLSYENGITITLQAEVLEDDTFQVYYKNEFDKGFSGFKSIKKEVSGNSYLQDIQFQIPLDSVANIRLDIGENSTQKPIYYHIPI